MFKNNMYIYIDGGCWPNPGGDMYYAYSVFENEIKQIMMATDINQLFESNNALEFNVGYSYNRDVESSNNVAEYVALYTALNNFKFERDSNTIFMCDSLMLVNQMIGKFKVRSGRYESLFNKCINKKYHIEVDNQCNMEFKHTPRENNISGIALEIFREKFYHN